MASVPTTVLESSTPPLSAEATLRLARAYRDDGDVRARKELIERHLPLVRAVARRHANQAEPLEDLVQVGAVGLIQAVDRFDPDRGVPLAAYAQPAVDGAVRRHLRDLAAPIRPPRRLTELSASLRRLEPELEAQLARPPTAAELATAAGADEREVLSALESDQARRPISLSVSPEELPPLPATEDGYADSERRLLVRDAFRALGRRERRILRLRFYAGLSQEEIASEVGLSQVHVSRLIHSSLAKMRAALGPANPRQSRHTLAG